MRVKVRLSKNITESEFLIATFGQDDFEVGTYDIEKMKTTTLEGETMDADFQVKVPRRVGEDAVAFMYSDSSMLIWDNVDDLEGE